MSICVKVLKKDLCVKMIINHDIPVLNVVWLGIVLVRYDNIAWGMKSMKVHETVPQCQEGADMSQSERVKT